jgi:carbamoyl-phosphate synthase small subunit
MPLSIESLIDRLGGPDAAAKLTAVSTEAVRKWRSTGAIPSRHWPTVLAATGLSLDALPGGVNHDAPTHKPDRATAALVLGDGRVFWGIGFGAHSRPDHEAAELCFSTGMAGYQETPTGSGAPACESSPQSACGCATHPENSRVNSSGG